MTTRRHAPILKFRMAVSLCVHFVLFHSHAVESEVVRFDDAIREAHALADRGHRELVLTGVNIGQYRDADINLLSLLERLEAISGLDRIRISSIEPTTIPEQLLDYMATSTKLCRFLHVPLQSGDDRILNAMNRRYTVREYTSFIEKAACRIPDLCIGTDVMVGFPGEREHEFANTRTVVNKSSLRVHACVLVFSSRPGTAAAKHADQVSPKTIKTKKSAIGQAVATEASRVLPTILITKS